MSRYEIRGFALYDNHGRKIATARDQAIYDAGNTLVAMIREEWLYDKSDRQMASIRGSDIFDTRGIKVASAVDVQNAIKGASTSILHMALWYCFVR